MRSWHPLTWVVLAVGLLAIVVLLLLPDDAAVPVRAVERPSALAQTPLAADAPAPTAPVQTSGPATLAPFEALTETTTRPLFAATRRPAPPEPVAEQAAAPVMEMVPEPAPAPAPVERTDFVLVGIVQKPEGAFVMLKPRAGGAVVTAHEGDDAGGWHVEAITPTAVRLTSPAGDAKHVLFAPRPAGDQGGPAGAMPYQ
ncbi:hypothetical protein E9232_003403 [Inquilinus ginsengisoli]|uniref:Type II secretion system protein GspC N-terminal domain-containing protein n=1 Tax=Inquilinus ginsengisoli TaxID=363840 RepID=A0ABU1JRE3_9PROT|nr:hypothetical protein [Inquilinus ginsengisoli]MDR6290877.1 hypothetical protein [Inquilinus ginsengisoli]